MSEVSTPAIRTKESWHRWVAKPITAGRALFRGVSALVTDMTILGNMWRDGTVLRQAQTSDFKILVRTDEEVGRRIYYHGKLAEPEIEFIRSVIRPSDICMDIGANVGYYTLLLAGLAHQGQVHAFEPVPLNYHLLSASALANKLPNVVVNRLAVSDAEGCSNFVLAEDSAYSSLLNTERKRVSSEFQVETTTIAKYCANRGIRRVDFMKVDVEGAEEKVVAGAAPLLSDPARRPRVVMLELYDGMLVRFGSSIPRMLDLMKGFGYAPYAYLGGLVPFEKMHFDVCYNVIFMERIS